MAKSTPVNPRSTAAWDAVAQIKDKFGEGAIMRLGEAKTMEVEAISTQCLSLDLALGVGGFPRGRVIEVYGPEASGKTSLTLHTIAEAQKQGGIAAFVDAEHALDPEYAAKLGVKVDELLISQPDSGEQALDIVETLVRSGGIDVIVIDSVAALVPKAEIEGEMGDQHMGLQARLMSQALRKLTPLVSNTRTCLIFINQTRMKIGIVFGNPETTTGGKALLFYASVRVEVRRAAQIKQNERVIGNRVKAKIAKNKVAPPFRQCEFDIMYNEGISVTGDLLDLGVIENIIEKRGNSYVWGDVKLGMGREAAKAYLRQEPKLMADLRAAILEAAEKREATEHPAIRAAVPMGAAEEEPAMAEA
ncbi:recombinase RecA [Candidatus Uhrbacteria bacterium]|nr:recombinase RecA [Candidatus Uhrbacteria bacterium]